MAATSPYTIAALLRGLRVLSLFDREHPDLSLTDIQRKADLNKSTAFRIVATLEAAGYLARDPENKRYRPGLKVLQLGFSAVSSLEVRQVARPFLQQLSRDTDETVSLSILDDMEVVYVDRFRRHQIYGVVLGIGSRIPAHCASMGKAMLAHLPRQELRERLLQRPLSPCTQRSITDALGLEEELSRVQQLGYALNDEELAIGLRAVAAPIWDREDQVVAACNVTGSVRTISQERLRQELAPAVRSTAHQISQALGYGTAT